MMVDILDEISKDLIKYLDRNKISNKTQSFVSGLPGVILLLAYLEIENNDKKYSSQIDEYLDICLNQLERNSELSLFSGFTGTAWLVRHLINLKLYDPNSVECLIELDSLIVKSSKIHLLNKNYSIMYGLLGTGIYYLEMLDSKGNQNQSSPIDPRIELSKMIDSLETLSYITMPGMRTWKDRLSMKLKDQDVIYNLGIPHGVPGIILFLCKLIEFDINAEKAKKLIMEASYWLLSKKRNFYDISFYGPFEGDYDSHLTRLGWSYGDLCVSIALLKASIILEDELLKTESYKTAMMVTKRDIINSNIYYEKNTDNIDFGLCKGSMGITIMLQQLSRNFSDNEIMRAFNFWLNTSISKRKDREWGISGFKSYTTIDYENAEYIDDIGFLDGTSGTALGLLSTLDEKYSGWQRLLMLR